MKCGTQMSGDVQFCVGCGTQMSRKSAPERPQQDPYPDEPPPKKKAGRVILVILLLLIIAGAASYFYFREALDTPPDMRAYLRGSERLQVTGGGFLRSGGSTLGGGAGRDTSKYTFLILGADEGEANTDVIMVMTFDTADHTIDVVSIPRDTLVNVSWPTKKANSIFANMRHMNRNESNAAEKTMTDTVSRFADVIGFEVDYWVRVDMRAFVSLVDAIGGVEFYVPVNMSYSDPWQDLSIQYTEGMHHLSGQQALEVLRFRSGYRTGDIGRIGTQQDFLKSAAEQIISNRNSLNVTTLARVFLRDVKTDMSLSDLIWFGRAFFRLDAEDVNFHMLPANTGDSVGRQSYVTINVGEWLEMVNSIFSPFSDDITPQDVSILTRGSDRGLYVTDGNWRGDPNWGR